MTVYRYLINNANFESYIKVVKKDAETGNTIPYAGAGFQIYDPSGNLVRERERALNNWLLELGW